MSDDNEYVGQDKEESMSLFSGLLYAVLLAVAISATAIILGITAIAFEAWVATVIWSWFIQPYVGWTLTFWVAFGLNLVGTLFTFSYTKLDSEKKQPSIASVAFSMTKLFIPAASILAFGWVVHLLFF